MAKTLCKIVGLVLILVGVVGFVSSNLLGMHLTMVHNVIHLLSGALAAYIGFAGSAASARTFSLAFGAIYGLLGVLGFVTPAFVANLLQAHQETGGAVPDMTADSAVHLLIAVVFLAAGLLSGRAPSRADA